MTNKATLTRDRIKAENAKPMIVPVEVPQWGTTAYIRVMSGTERDAYEASITGTRVTVARGRNAEQQRTLNLTNIRARLVARCLCDENGALLYDASKPADLDELGSTRADVLDLLFTEASQLNGITEKDIEDLTKNLKAEANGVSGSN